MKNDIHSITLGSLLALSLSSFVHPANLYGVNSGTSELVPGGSLPTGGPIHSVPPAPSEAPRGLAPARRTDCNQNGLPDECDLDCGEPGGVCDIPDCGGSTDCNENTVPDECDIANGTSQDRNDNGMPDECEEPLVQSVTLEFDYLRGLRNGSIEFDYLRGLRHGSVEFTYLRGIRNTTIGFDLFSEGRQIEVLPEPIDFGSEATCQVTTKVATVTNIGYADLTVTNITLAPTAEFTLVDTPDVPFILPQGTSAEVTLSFLPTAVGPVSTTLTFISDDDDPEDQTLVLEVTGEGSTDDGRPTAPAPAPYPHNRAKNRYLSFDLTEAENDGRNVAFRVMLTSLILGSCNDGGSPNIAGWACRTDDDCRACSVNEAPCWTASLHCPPSETCELTGAQCVNDQAGSVGTSWWVGPEHPTLANDVHLLVTEAYRKMSADWPAVVHVADCEIVPVASYDVQAIAEDVEAYAVCDSPPLTIDATPKPNTYWADCVGPLGDYCTGTWACCDTGDPPNTNCPGATCPVGESCIRQWPPPDSIINFNDITAAVFAFQQVPGLTVPQIMWVDLHGSAAGDAHVDPPNYIVNFDDIGLLVKAFEGWPYPYSDPGDCPTDVGSWP